MAKPKGRRRGRGTPPRRPPDALLEELKEVAGRLGLEVREERLLREVGYRVRSGACRFREQNLLFLDRELSVRARAEVLLDELSRRDLSEVYLSPEIRSMLGQDGPAQSASDPQNSIDG